VTAETPALVRLDGGGGFGLVVGRRAMEMAIAKARAGGLSAASTSRTSHVGRLADYAEMAAAPGLVGMLWANCVHGLNVAPWGGAARRLGTNPHAVAVPGVDGPAMVLDFATSVWRRQAAREAQSQAARAAGLVRGRQGPARDRSGDLLRRSARRAPPPRASTRATASRSRSRSWAASSPAPGPPPAPGVFANAP
jgi:hypothetical protein